MKSVEISGPLVSVDWFHSHLDAKNLVVLDASIPKVTGAEVQTIEEQIAKIDLPQTFFTFNEFQFKLLPFVTHIHVVLRLQKQSSERPY